MKIKKKIKSKLQSLKKVNNRLLLKSQLKNKPRYKNQKKNKIKPQLKRKLQNPQINKLYPKKHKPKLLMMNQMLTLKLQPSPKKNQQLLQDTTIQKNDKIFKYHSPFIGLFKASGCGILFYSFLQPPQSISKTISIVLKNGQISHYIVVNVLKCSASSRISSCFLWISSSISFAF